MDEIYRIIAYFCKKNHHQPKEIADNILERGFSKDEIENLLYFQEDPDINPFLILMTKYYNQTINFRDNITYFNNSGLQNEMIYLYYGLINLSEKENIDITDMIKRLDENIYFWHSEEIPELEDIKRMLINTIKYRMAAYNEFFDGHYGIDNRITGLCFKEVLTSIIFPSEEEEKILDDKELRIFHPGFESENYDFNYLQNLSVHQRHQINEIVNMVIIDYDNYQNNIFDMLEPLVELDEYALDTATASNHDNKTKIKKEQQPEIKKLNFSKLKNQLNDKIIGQEAQIEKFVKRLKVLDFGGLKEKGAKGVFLLAGPTGVGKTELAKLFSSSTKIPLIRMDMSEYKESHSVSKIYGSPPGYIGYDERGTKVFDKINGQAIILLDEIEKAHPRVLDTFLHVFDEGKAKDNRQNEIDFSECFFIMTTNIGAFESSKNPIGFNSKKNNQNIYQGALEVNLKPEFINRIDEIVYFKNLEKNDIFDIICLALDKMAHQLNQKGYQYNFLLDESAVDYLLSKINYQKYGARDVFRVLSEEIVPNLMEMRKTKKETTLGISYQDEIVLKKLKDQVYVKKNKTK